MSEEEKRAYKVLFVANSLLTLGFGIADPFFSLYAVSSGAGGFHLALIFSGYAAAKTLMSPLTGWLSDFCGRRGLILGGLGLHCAISLSYLSLPGPSALVLLRFLQGIAAAMVRPVSLALVGDTAPAGKEGAAMGSFDISFYGALAVGPLLGGFIKDLTGFSGLFSILAILCGCSFITALFLTTAPLKMAKNGAHRVPGKFLVLRKSKTLLGLSGFIFTRSFGITLFAIFIPVFMYKNLGLSGSKIGLTMGAATVATVLLLKPMGYLSDRVDRGLLVTIGGGMAALLTFCLPLAGGFCQLLLLSAGIGVFSVVSLPASSALLVEEGNLYGMGLTMGLFNGAMNAASVLAPLAGGALVAFLGINALFYGAGMLGLLGIAFFFMCIRTPHHSLFHYRLLHRATGWGACLAHSEAKSAQGLLE